MNLEDLGFNDFFKNKLKNFDSGSPVVRIISESRGSYIVRDEKFEYLAKITGKFRYQVSNIGDYPVVGDWVMIEKINDKEAMINQVLPRQSKLKRKANNKDGFQVMVSNIDNAFIVQSPERDFSINRYERYVAIAKEEGINPILVLNKVDIISDEEKEEKLNELRGRFSDLEIISTSTVKEGGLEELRSRIIAGKTYCFLGSSGVGKSSLVNLLLENANLKTGAIGQKNQRGRHVTTSRGLYIMKNGGILIDTPGMREIGIVDSDQGIEKTFSNIADIARQCKFSNCSHVHEPGCAVLKALEDGLIDRAKFDNYQRMKRENDYNNMTLVERRRKDKDFGKMVKGAMKFKKRYKD